MRIVRNINENWKFMKTGEGVQEVNLPHTWNEQDGQDGGNDYFRGTCIYEKKMIISRIQPDAQIYLECLGVNASAKILVNGQLCKVHEGGYSAFRVNITEYLNQMEEENILQIHADNAPSDHIYPQRADFTFYGGVYRDVNLIEVSDSHFDLDYFGGTGLQITPEVTGEQAKIKAEAYFTGNASRVEISLDGQSVSCVIEEMEHGKKRAYAELTVEDVHLWNGLEDPYLYQATAVLIAGDQIIDEVKTQFGCRTYSIDAEKGFFLNGKSYPLHGVSRHQDRKGVGNALTQEMQEEDLSMILEAGANAIRFAHYQHNQYFLDLCDRHGLIVWAEIPYISEHLTAGRDNTISQMKELIVQNYNHPSIICWALSNEISLTGVTEDLLENHHILNDLAHKLDPSRLTVMANLFMLETDNPLTRISDVISYNLYYGWYVGELEENDRFFDEFHQTYPDRAIGLSEYGADAIYHIQSSNPIKGDYSEQYQAVYHEHMLEMFDQRPYLWSTFVWNMFDFAADGRDEGDDPGVNHKGLVSFDRKVRKDAFYIYKAWWSQDPFVHLCGSRYKNRTEEVTEIKVYSNQPKVTLYVDERELATKEGMHIFRFEVPLAGIHQIRAVAGEFSDAMEICKVQEQDPSYILKNSSVKNWFEEPGMEVREGYLSIRDTVGDIKSTPAGKVLIDAFLAKMTQSLGDMAQKVEITEAMEQIMNRMPLEKLIMQGGNSVEAATMVQLNQQLTQIPKTTI